LRGRSINERIIGCVKTLRYDLSEPLKLRDSSFDGACTDLSFKCVCLGETGPEFLPQPVRLGKLEMLRKYVNEVFRVLKAGGRYTVSTYTKENADSLIQLIEERRAEKISELRDSSEESYEGQEKIIDTAENRFDSAIEMTRDVGANCMSEEVFSSLLEEAGFKVYCSRFGRGSFFVCDKD
jgi:hypothetical protein